MSDYKLELIQEKTKIFRVVCKLGVLNVEVGKILEFKEKEFNKILPILKIINDNLIGEYSLDDVLYILEELDEMNDKLTNQVTDFIHFNMNISIIDESCHSLNELKIEMIDKDGKIYSVEL